MNLSLRFHPRAKKQLTSALAKHYKQIHEKILSLTNNPYPQDSRHMAGYPGYFRVTQGEYRVIYSVTDTTLNIEGIGNKNDDPYEVFRRNH